MPQFDVTTFSSQFFWLVVVFGLLYLIVYKFVVPAAEKILKNRESILGDNINNANILTKKTQELQKLYNAEMKNIENITANIKHDALANLEASLSLKKAELEKELEKEAKKVMIEIDKNIKTFKDDQSDACLDVAKFIIEKITGCAPDQQLLKKCYEKVK